MSRIHLFATRCDWLGIFELVETSAHLRYAPAGQHPSDVIDAVLHGRDIPGLGSAQGEQLVACDSWLIGLRATELCARSIDRDDGTRWFAMDQMRNPDTTIVTPGGEWEDGTIIHGEVATLAKAGAGMKLQRLFASHIKKLSTRIGEFWVAPDALSRREAGWRLCTGAVSSPPEYDLPLP